MVLFVLDGQRAAASVAVPFVARRKRKNDGNLYDAVDLSSTVLYVVMKGTDLNPQPESVAFILSLSNVKINSFF